MKLKDLINKGIETVSSAFPKEEAREMVFSYLDTLWGIRRVDHILNPEMALSPEQERQAFEAFDMMAADKPLQYVTGKAYFYGRSFNVSPAVLIPRPETELLCRSALDYATRNFSEKVRVLDLCTGSGCIAWTMAAELKKASVEAVDISEEALRVASSQKFPEENISTPQFRLADVLTPPETELPEDEKYDIILSNPPYVRNQEKKYMRKNVLDFEPHLALFVPDDDPLLFYQAVCGWALKCLKHNGYGIVEINEELGVQTAEIFSKAGFSNVRILKDFQEKDRFVEFTRMLL